MSHWNQKHSYSRDNDENKTKTKTNVTKKVCHIRKLKFEGYKHCLEATQLRNEINQPEKNKPDVVSLRKNHK